MFIAYTLSFMFSILPVSEQRPVVGSKAIDFTLESFEGTTVKLSELQGKVVLLDFWASWCIPCREELPLLDILVQTYGREKFTVLAVNVDNDPRNAQKFLEKHSIKLDALWDKDKKVVSSYDVQKMPTTLLIDKDGWIRFIHPGFETEQFFKYKQQIETLLREKRSPNQKRAR